MAISVNSGSTTNNVKPNETDIPVSDNIIESPLETDEPVSMPASDASSIAGLSSVEQNDPNSITVTVSDPTTPIVVLYGPPSCGKTMTLVRMTRYLQSEGYTVVPEKTFRPTYDDNYKQLCDNFDQTINSNNAASSTSNMSFMLVKVLKNGKPICQMFENKNPITKFFTKYNCEFVPFMTGSYSETMSGGLTYTEGHPVYAQKFWQAMLKLING